MLTPLGQMIVARGRSFLIDVDDLQTLARAHSNPLKGELRLGAIPTIDPFLIPNALPSLRTAFPDLRIYLRKELTDSLIEGLNTGRLDLILIALPYETGPLEIAPLFEDGYQLASPPKWPTPKRSGANLLDGHQRLMLLEKGHCLQRHALMAYPGKLSIPEDDFAATSLATLIAMVSEGLGITLLPKLAIAAGIADGKNIRITDLPDACPRQVVLAWRKGASRADVYKEVANCFSKVTNSRQDGANIGSGYDRPIAAIGELETERPLFRLEMRRPPRVPVVDDEGGAIPSMALELRVI